ncbi:putative metallo AIM14 [Cyphellophora attinorum]|uniref:ferric-chelate reductase (NADPH) n=1 Tax=Cyphellophora attinorum TaxID=1664694 RepID=A0A0N1HVM6_9EURO|nr:putative metallo AIM14 [Phialophora attinorum]KPI41387.1 putative metallo AIM14 [Phialophora attinorum]
MLGYEYIFPTPAEYEVVRQQLETAGFTAWLMPILLLINVYVYRSLKATFASISISISPKKGPSSSRLQILARRIHWNLTQPLNQTLGPPSRLLAAFAYLFYLVYIAQADTGKSYLHLTKSLGHVAVSQLPWHYLLAIKSPNSPITIATGLTHERLNAWHRILGRIIAVLAFGHAALYLKFFVDMGVLKKRLGDWEPRLGLAAVVTMAGLVVGSLAVVRRKSYYRGFYVGHVLMSAALVVELWLHMRWTRRYVAQMGAWWVVNAVLRARQVKAVEASVIEEASDADGLIVLKLGSKDAVIDTWIPGQHVYIRLADGVIGSTVGRKNPFTIADVSKDATQLTLVARKLAGTTAMLKNCHNKAILLEGPYGEAAEYMPSLIKAGKSAGLITLYAAGVGATYILPIYLALLKARGDTVDLRMKWFVKTPADAVWGVDLLRRAEKRVFVSLFLTRAQSGWRGKYKFDVPGLVVHDEREERGSVRRISSMQRSDKEVTVMVCGPPGFSAQLRAEIGRYVKFGTRVVWYEEEFGFGG